MTAENAADAIPRTCALTGSQNDQTQLDDRQLILAWMQLLFPGDEPKDTQRT